MCSQNCEMSLLVLPCLSVCLSVCPSTWNNMPPTGQVFIKSDKHFLNICQENSSFIKTRQEQVLYMYTYIILWCLSCWIFVIRNVSNKCRTENQNTHFMFKSLLFWKSCLLQDNRDKHGMLDWPQMTIWSIHFTWWITKATDTHIQNI